MKTPILVLGIVLAAWLVGLGALHPGLVACDALGEVGIILGTLTFVVFGAT